MHRSVWPAFAAILPTFAATWSVHAGTIWGIKSEAGLIAASTAPARLFWLDDTGTTFSPSGAIHRSGTPIDVDALSVAADGRLLAFELIHASASPFDVTGSHLIQINPDDQSAIRIGAELPREIRGASFDADGNLWVLDSLGDQLVQIDPGTGAELDAIDLTLSGPFDIFSTADIAFDASGTAWIVNSNGLYTLDIATGILTLEHEDTEVGPDGFSLAHAGAAFSPDPLAAGRLFAYDITQDDDLVAYDTTQSFTRSNVFQDIIAEFNAGRGDLASHPFVACAADLTGDSSVDVFDLLAYLDLWFAGDGAAERTGDDPAAIDVFDLLSYLDDWFAGC